MNNQMHHKTSPNKSIKKLMLRIEKAEAKLKSAADSDIRKKAQKEFHDLKAQLAWQYLDENEFEKGLAIYQSLSWNTYGEEKYNGMSRALIETGRFTEAKTLLEKGLSRFPESPSLLVAMGNLYHKLGYFEKSLKHFERALAYNPENEFILFSKANALYGLNLYENALPVYKNLAEKYPDESLFITQVGYCHLQMGYPEDASGHFKSLINKGCAVSEDYNGLYCSYYDMGLKDDAIEIAKEGIRKFPKDDPVLYSNLGAAYFEQGWLSDARDIVSEGLKKFPKDEGLKELLKAIEDEIDNPDDDDKKPPIKEILIISALIKKLRNKRAFRPKK